MGGRRGLAGCLLVLILTWPQMSEAQSSDRQRPIRVGNRNVITIGGGSRDYDLPTFSEKGFFTMGYQRRILRREVRWLPLWVRGAFDFASEATDTDSTYSVWLAREAANPNVTVIKDERVQERSSDFALRFELLADFLNLPNFALYGGGGLIVHIVSFSSRGTTTKYLFERRENFLGPSLVAGGRLFMKSQPWAIYSEVRYRKVYGKLDPPPDDLPYFTDQSFEFMNTNAVSIEGGLALHW